MLKKSILQKVFMSRKIHIISFPLIFLTLSILFIFLTGCSQYGDEKHLLDIEFHKGIKGVDFDIFGIMPEVYEKTAFKISLNLFNKGAYDLPDSGGFVNLNLEEDYMCITADGVNCVDASGFVGSGAGTFGPVRSFGQGDGLKGKSITNPSGDFEFVDFSVLAREIDQQSVAHDSVIGITACYQYRTDLVTEVCVDPYFYDPSKIAKPCGVQDMTFSGQGAPVVISKIETKMLSAGQASGQQYVKPLFIIHVENRGQGNVINGFETANVCSSDVLSQNAFNIIHLTSVEFLNYKFNSQYDNNDPTNTLDCDMYHGNEILLRDGRAQIRCTVKGKGIGPEIGTITTQLKIVVDYGYTISKTKKIKIKALGNY